MSGKAPQLTTTGDALVAFPVTAPDDLPICNKRLASSAAKLPPASTPPHAKLS